LFGRRGAEVPTAGADDVTSVIPAAGGTATAGYPAPDASSLQAVSSAGYTVPAASVRSSSVSLLGGASATAERLAEADRLTAAQAELSELDA
ncbi:hypothetical protein ACO1M4_14100, partial [Staphylococcus aureus]